MNLHIKNMVCNRCIKVVREELENLCYTISSIKLGEVEVEESLDNSQIIKLSNVLEENGFELLTDNKAKLIDKIKSKIIQIVHYSDDTEKEGILYSSELEKDLGYEYSYLSNLFSTTENITIEQYTILQKIERVKELLKYEEFTLSEIAFKVGYSSVQHLSKQFKQTTGLTASEFKKQTSDLRKPLDSI